MQPGKGPVPHVPSEESKQKFKQRLVMCAAWQGEDLGFFPAGFLRFLRIPVTVRVFPVSG